MVRVLPDLRRVGLLRLHPPPHADGDTVFSIYLGLGGTWPLSEVWCVFYQTCDVLACSVSILHLMFISIGRYRGISKPLVQRQVNQQSGGNQVGDWK